MLQISIHNFFLRILGGCILFYFMQISSSEQERKTSFHCWTSMAFITLKFYAIESDSENLLQSLPLSWLHKSCVFLSFNFNLTINILHRLSPTKLLSSASLFFLQPLLVLQYYSLFCVFDYTHL